MGSCPRWSASQQIGYEENLCDLQPMLISEKDNGGSKTEESNDAAKDKLSFGGMHCGCIPFFVCVC